MTTTATPTSGCSSAASAEVSALVFNKMFFPNGSAIFTHTGSHPSQHNYHRF